MFWIEDQSPVLKWDPNPNPNIDLLRRPSIPGELWSWPIHKQKVKVKGHSVRKLKWTDEGDCNTSHANAVGKNVDRFSIFFH